MVEDYVNVGKLSDFEAGEIRACRVHGEEVAVVKLDGKLHAFSNVCTHEGLGLSGYGDLLGRNVICTMHSSIFKIETGRVVGGPAGEPLTVYDVRLEDGDVLIRRR
jgi:3-phenylpropionate/trans-cinnamate dioxygenase ferredoxin subunit